MFFSDSSKNLIFRVLFEEWPLSAKEIYSRVEKISSKEISYQAVHKLLLSFVEEGIVIKIEGKYLLNQQWVEKNLVFLSKLLENLKTGSKVFSFEEKIIFETIFEVDKFLVETCKRLELSKNDEIVLQWIHFWIPLFVEKNTYCEMREFILKSNFYSITPNAKPIDKWCAEFWKKLGVKEKIGVKFGFDNSFFVFRDMIVQVFYPIEIKNALDEVYNSTKDPSKLDINNFFKTVFEKKTRIPVLVSRNKIVADELRRQVKSCF
ncbi:MAG: hypothetical protein PHP82_00500 [Candidatus ainarchaeum sp.]|nr:hypothetical protein [Candidatus ainarchaeum sp.]